ncbi:MAG: hypothetical protein ACI31R_02800 [Bacilli bacterium]
MESGTFNDVFKLDKYIIKISKSGDEIFNQVMSEINFENVKQYEQDINRLGIKTARIYDELEFSNYKVLIQEYIEGSTLEDILSEKKYDIDYKLQIFSKYANLYKLCKQDENLCLDWNLKNFIYNDEELVYVDLTPCLYKNKIKNIESENLIQFRDSFLNENITIAGILGYTLKALLKSETKEILEKAYSKIKTMLEYEEPNEINDNHVYLDKLSLIEKFLYSDMDLEELFILMDNYSMKKQSLSTNKVRENKSGNYKRQRI